MSLKGRESMGPKVIKQSAEWIGTASGMAGGPLGALLGKVTGQIIGRFFKAIVIGTAFVLFFFWGCVIQSWCPVIFNHVTLIHHENRSDRIIQSLTGYGHSVSDFNELKSIYRLLKGKVEEVSESLTESEQDAVQKAIEEPWDMAYLCAAYAVYTEMHQKGPTGKTLEDEMLEMIGSFLKNAVLGYEVEVTRTETEPATYPIFEKRSIQYEDKNGIFLEKEIYIKISEEKTYESRLEPVFKPIQLEDVMMQEGDQTTFYETLSCYERISGESRLYVPVTREIKEVKHLYGGLKKSTILMSMGLHPEASYAGMEGLSHAAYAEYLRKALIKTIGNDSKAGIVGRYLWPCPGYQEITSWFGKRSAEETDGIGSTDHGGIDIGAPMGAEVIACASGKIVQSGVNGGYGQSVEIDHGNGIRTLYAHLSEIKTELGCIVDQGEVIGLVGSTGNSTGPHLHLSVYENGAAIDPMHLFSKAEHPYGLAPETSFNGSAGNVESWRPAVIAALEANGLSTDLEMVEKVLRQIQTESGGNEQSVQQIHDVNSGQAIPFNNGNCPWCPPGTGCANTNIGHGLMQTIPSTFKAYCHADHENIFNGYDNLLAALCYAKTQYGPELSGLGEGHGY